MAEEAKQATERVVIKQARTTADENERWEVVGRVTASTKKQAIDHLAKDKPGKYRAIPLRSWKGGTEIVLPEKPKPESRPFE